MYIVGLGLLLAAIGIGINRQARRLVQATNEQRKQKALSRLYIFIGVGMICISGSMMVHGNLTSYRDRLEHEQLIQLPKDKVPLKKGAAQVKVEVKANTKVTIKHQQGKVDPIKLKAHKTDQTVTLVFVLPGKYEVLGERKGRQEKVWLKIERPAKAKAKQAEAESSEVAEVVAPPIVVETVPVTRKERAKEEAEPDASSSISEAQSAPSVEQPTPPAPPYRPAPQPQVPRPPVVTPRPPVQPTPPPVVEETPRADAGSIHEGVASQSF